jgi:type II secretory pathway pseudopilin PulG
MKSREVCKRKFGVNEKGASLVIALMILLILTLIGISALQTTTHEVNIAGNERLYNRAFYTSDAGIDYFFSQSGSYILTPNTMLDSKTEGLDFGGPSFNVTWTQIMFKPGPPVTKDFLVTSRGIVPNFPAAGRVTIEAIIEVVSQDPPEGYAGG